MRHSLLPADDCVITCERACCHRQEIEDMKAANERRLAEMSARLEALNRKQDELASLAENSTQIEALVSGGVG
jgi:hypothetical protein